MHCKTCKWWGVWYAGVCDFPNTVMSAKAETRFEIQATTSDDTGLEAQLITGPEFGCIHHEAKTKGGES